jgi:hypothetical protein
MIWFALIVSGIALTAFTAIVISILLCERRKSLFDPSNGGLADAFTRNLLALHVCNAANITQSQPKTHARDLARR